MPNERAVPPEVLVRVAPRLLSDTLCLVLADAGLRVASCPPIERRTGDRPARHFDVAVVTGAVPAHASADRVIVIDEQGGLLGSEASAATESALDNLLHEVRRAVPCIDVAEGQP